MKVMTKFLVGVVVIFMLGFAYIARIYYEVRIIPRERYEEKQEIDELHHWPMEAIYYFLKAAMTNCRRFPLENEFNHFLVNGVHKDIQCSELIKTNLKKIYGIPSDRAEGQFLSDFIKRGQYKVISDSKRIYVIYKNDPKRWKYKHFEREEYDKVILCKYSDQYCVFMELNDLFISCRNSDSFEDNNCYLGGKKIFDY